MPLTFFSVGVFTHRPRSRGLYLTPFSRWTRSLPVSSICLAGRRRRRNGLQFVANVSKETECSFPDDEEHEQVNSRSVQEGLARFRIDGAFYKPQSKVVRDLGVLAASVLRQERGELHVLDLMAGSGVRSLRYLHEAGATSVWCNEANLDAAPLLRQNVSQLDAPAVLHDTYQETWADGEDWHVRLEDENLLSRTLSTPRVKISHLNAKNIIHECALRQQRFDLVDLDAFGSASRLLPSVLDLVRYGGFVYVTTTDARLSAGHQPSAALRAYGSYPRHHPAVNEQALRLGLAYIIQSAAATGVGIEPVFSLFSRSTCRLMLRVTPSPSPRWTSYHGFLQHCPQCGEFQTVPWKDMSRGAIACTTDASHEPILSGPLWLGPLHDPDMLAAMAAEAEKQGDTIGADARRAVYAMQEEWDMPPYHYSLRVIAKAAGCDTPSPSWLCNLIREHGFAASATHLDRSSIKTTAPLAFCIQQARAWPKYLAESAAADLIIPG